jgi:hypothetical protein
MPKQRTTQSKDCRHYCFTWFGQKEDPNKDLHELLGEDLLAACYQQEICPETKRHHLQGYIGFKVGCGKKITWIIKRMPGAHLTVCRGTAAENLAYCTKVDYEGKGTRIQGTEPYIYGTEFPDKKRQGDRSDIHEVVDLMKKGVSCKEMIDNHPGLTPTISRNMRFMKELRKAFPPPKVPRENVRVTYCYSAESGTGKSTCGGFYNDDIWRFKKVNSFYMGYEGQTKCIIDRMDGSKLKPLDFQEFCQDMPLSLNVKWGEVQCAVTDIRITSRQFPEAWWKEGTLFKYDAVERRIHECHWHRVVKGEFIKHAFVSDEGGYALAKMKEFIVNTITSSEC